MKLYIKLAMAIFFAPICLFGQNSHTPGYIVSVNSGNTIRSYFYSGPGYVDNIEYQGSDVSGSTALVKKTRNEPGDSTVNKPVRFFAGLALNIANTSPDPTSPFYAGGGRSSTSNGPAISFGMDAFANPNTKKVLLRLEISFVESHYKSSYQNQVSPYVPVRASFDEQWFSFTPQVIYHLYNAENFKFYAGAGVLIVYYKYSNSYFGGQDPNTSSTQLADNNPFDFNNFDTPILLKVGFEFNKKLGIYVNYITTAATTRGGYFALTKTAEQFGINYFFGK